MDISLRRYICQYGVSWAPKQLKLCYLFITQKVEMQKYKFSKHFETWYEAGLVTWRAVDGCAPFWNSAKLEYLQDGTLYCRPFLMRRRFKGVIYDPCPRPPHNFITTMFGSLRSRLTTSFSKSLTSVQLLQRWPFSREKVELHKY